MNDHGTNPPITAGRSATLETDPVADEIRRATDNAAAPPTVSVIVPTYREHLNIPVLVPAIHAALGGASLSHEIVVVDDDSRDGSIEAVEELARTIPVCIVVRRGERGLASAVVRGFREANGEVLVCMDADGSHPAEALPALVRPLLSGEADFTVGSRYVKGGTTDEAWSFFRRLNSRVATLLAWSLTELRDPMSGYFALPRALFASVGEFDPTGFKIGLELAVRLGPLRTAEIPIHFRDRKHGTSKLGIRQQAEYLVQIMSLHGLRRRRGLNKRSPSANAAKHS